MGQAIEVRQLVKRFDDVVAVAGVDLDVPTGACVGLLGPNGAGKTTTVEILEGLQEQTSGSVRVLGRSWADGAAEIRARIGVQLQDTQLEGRLTVEETLRLFRSFYPRGISVDEAIRIVQLDEKRRAPVKKLSGGQRQRLALATALVGDPELLVLDEPTTGLDPQARRALWEVIEALRGRGRTVLLTTHYMEEAERLCDRLVIVDHGKVVAEGTPPELIARLGGAQMIELSSLPALEPDAWSGVPGLVGVRQNDGAAVLSVKELHVALPAVLAAAQARGSALARLSTRQAT
ncbi:MAG TPA: ABC transporter ATP-binding protein, partial [Myxococcaceae bacterium]|nr:ABC transporter ATP-binding protein [Myxococcaceae bacterium]